MPRAHTGISIPTELVDEVRKVIRANRLCYDSPTDFIKEAIRMHLLTIEPKPKEAEEQRRIVSEFPDLERRPSKG